ncbi:MAG: three-Cys-motif partner protein TcmP [Thaumarchaeota archaeon]|nr:three-Cys-motif partner protein TcmP [Nitrososphaerota archaeon]
MGFDAFNWSKNKISLLVDKISLIKNDNLVLAPGEIWSLKKSLALDYYIEGSVNLFKKYFNNWYYVDTHCGSGLIGFSDGILKGERFPGSPLIAALRALDSEFTEYLFFDNDSNAIDALQTRLNSLRPQIGIHNFQIRKSEFADSISAIEHKKKFGDAFLVFIDPVGFIEIRWMLMERLLKVEKADIFFTFMTHALARHRTNASPGSKYAESLDDFYGDSSWNQKSNGDELLQLYIDKIKHHRKYVLTIPVFQTGERKLYDIIIATDSKGANNIVADATEVMRVTDTEVIKSALAVATNKMDNITKWM